MVLNRDVGIDKITDVAVYVIMRLNHVYAKHLGIKNIK